MRVPLESIIFYVKVTKTGENIFLEVTVGLKKCNDLLVRHLIMVEANLQNPVFIHQKTQNLTYISNDKCTYKNFYRCIYH
jgi:hypothetical protein